MMVLAASVSEADDEEEMTLAVRRSRVLLTQDQMMKHPEQLDLTPFASQSRFVRQVIDTAIRYLDPKRIVLYGSRARGSAHATSDYDLAFVGLQRPQNWSRFVVELDENAETLLPFDLVCYEDAHTALQSQIDDDGVILYERSEN